MRKLASIQVIQQLEPIPGADAIETASVLGWKVVVKKGEFKQGQFCVYCEIDSVFPRRPEFDFLAERHYRIKTIKLRGQISQGIVFPLDILPETYIAKEDDDVTELLEIVKYELPERFAIGGSRGSFPGFLRKTDETRIQSIPSVLDIFNGKAYYITQKLDGTSATYYYHPEHGYGACSRNHLKDDGDNVYWNVGVKEDIEVKLKDAFEKYGRPFAIQGEICGPNIQGNKLGLPHHKLFLFNLYDIDFGKYVNGPINDWCTVLGFTPVPLLEEGDNFDYTLAELLEKARGKYPSGKNQEGIVVRLNNEELQCRGTAEGRPSFKVINNDFLLKDET